MYRFALALSCLVFVLTTLAHADDWSKTFDLTGKPELRVEATDANIQIEPWDQNKIEARVTTRGWHIGTGGQVEIVEHQQGNAVEIEIREHSHLHFSIGIDTRRIDVEIHMPRSGKVDVQTGDGHIEARGLAGDLNFKSGDGRVELADLDGTVRAKTSDGALHASGRFDRVELSSGDGRVELEARHGSKVSEDWEVRTSDGSVRVSLPTDLAANLDLHTGDGHITTDLPVTVQGKYDKSNVHGTINGGGRELRVHTGDGSITLEKSGV
ncbi:MAG TPA: DUF4097 family beta strand repeat-containing protein [Terriglobales bacterium]|nr:DUF4097 family beta strand repeat-containing protein [Terriglobales bacterium]